MQHTLVLAVDRQHLQELRLVLPTWRRHKPTLFGVPWVVVYDSTQVLLDDVRRIVDYDNAIFVSWPPFGVEYDESGNGKWDDPQRHKMLASFVYAAANHVKTEYWLKLDTDAVATGVNDWINILWFENSPAIVAHRWGYTKPPEQMAELDWWVELNKIPELIDYPPLDLVPAPGEKCLGHKRIISWCGFFNIGLTQQAADIASRVCGRGKLPVPSQDGYMWYLAARQRLEIRRVNMKALGWQHVGSGIKRLRKAVKESLRC